MALEQELKRVADNYRAQGYQVVVRPRAEDLPVFAQDFQVEIVGKRGSQGVLVAVKRNRGEFAADANMPRYAELTGNQPGWRFDFVILEGEPPMGRRAPDAEEFSREDIVTAMGDADRMANMGFVRAAVITAWAGLEAAMRMRLRAAGEKAGWGTSPRSLLNELYSSGIISAEHFRHLESLADLRNQIVHGFHSLPSDAGTVFFLRELTERLLNESQPAKQTA